jgi:hypothetical protein
MKRQKTGGRRKGAPNKATVERKLRAAHGVEAAVVSGLLPLDVLLRVMRGDETITERQFSAAQAAAPYVHPRLAATTLDAKVSVLDGLGLDEQRALAAALAALAGDAEELAAGTDATHH